jgi:hypothetical protein
LKESVVECLAATASIWRWLREMMAHVWEVRRRFGIRGQSTVTPGKSAKVAVASGQRACQRKVDRLPHLTVMQWVNAEGNGRLPMLVVPTSRARMPYSRVGRTAAELRHPPMDGSLRRYM